MDTVFTNAVISPFLSSARVQKYPREHTILYAGDPVTELYVIKRGAITMHDGGELGSRKIFTVFGPGTFFPMVSFSNEQVTSSWFYTTIATTEVYVLSYADLCAKFSKPEAITAYNVLLRQLLDEVHELLSRISTTTKTDSTHKLLATLRFLALHHTLETKRNWKRVAFPISHQLLAEMSGLARETVTLTLKDLQRDQIVRNPSKAKLEINIPALDDYGDDA